MRERTLAGMGAGIGAIIAFLGAATIRAGASIPPSQALEHANLRDKADALRHAIIPHRDGDVPPVAVAGNEGTGR